MYLINKSRRIKSKKANKMNKEINAIEKQNISEEGDN